MPGVKHTGNSEITALVSSDREKLGALGERYGVQHRYSYEEFAQLLASGEIDTVYLGTPTNAMSSLLSPRWKRAFMS